jgi:hypothetical protein
MTWICGESALAFEEGQSPWMGIGTVWICVSTKKRTAYCPKGNSVCGVSRIAQRAIATAIKNNQKCGINLRVVLKSRRFFAASLFCRVC